MRRYRDMQVIRAYLRYSEPKSEKFSLSDIFRYNPNGITLNNLKEISSKYNTLKFHDLIDYLSEWMAEYSRARSPIDIINIALSQRFYEESRDNHRGKLELSSFETYIYHVFKNHASSPEIFLEYLLGEKNWGIIQDRISKRTIEEKIELGNKIRKALEQAAATPRDTESHREIYSNEITEEC